MYVWVGVVVSHLHKGWGHFAQLSQRSWHLAFTTGRTGTREKEKNEGEWKSDGGESLSIVHLLCEDLQALASAGTGHGGRGGGYRVSLSAWILPHLLIRSFKALAAAVDAGHGSQSVSLACADWKTRGVCVCLCQCVELRFT